MCDITLRKGLLRKCRSGEFTQNHPDISPAPGTRPPSGWRWQAPWGAVLVVALTACGPGNSPTDRDLAACPAGNEQRRETIVLTFTATSAEPRPALSPSVLEAVEQAGRTDSGCLLLVGPDGRASALSLTPRRGGRVEAGSQRELLRRRTQEAIQALIADQAATAPGLDVPGAITRAIRAHPTPGRLVVITSGVSTVRPVDLVELTWQVDGLHLGAFLRSQGWLDLTGWDVGFVGLGRVAGKQPAVSEPARRTLTNLWLGLCKGAHARRCADLGSAAAIQPPRSTNDVPPVAPPSDTVFTDRVLLPMGTTFRIGSAVLSILADVRLLSVIDRVRREDLVITITGFADASTGDPDTNQQLSRQRAEAVRTRLIQLGLPGDRIISVDGLGSQPFSAEQERRDPSLVAAHRSVQITFSRPVTPS